MDTDISISITPQPPSPKQMSYLTDLVTNRAKILGVPVTPEIEKWLAETTKANASVRIEKAIAALKKAQVAKAKIAHTTASAAIASIDEGIYIVPDKGADLYYQVVTSESGHRYAKKFDRYSNTYQYSPGGIRVVSAKGRKITLSEAMEFGKAVGKCVCCGRTLTNPDSIKAGIGPICASKYF